jgi:hypothetical protein
MDSALTVRQFPRLVLQVFKEGEVEDIWQSQQHCIPEQREEKIKSASMQKNVKLLQD